MPLVTEIQIKCMKTRNFHVSAIRQWQQFVEENHVLKSSSISCAGEHKQINILWDNAGKLQSAHQLGGASLSTFPWLDGKLLEHVSTATNMTEEAMYCIQSHRFLCNTYRNVSVHTATNLQSTGTATNVITLLLMEVISIWFDQNLPHAENWPTEDRIRQNTEEVRISHKWILHFMWCSYNNLKGEGTPRKLATATQPQFPRKIANFKQATGFQISRHTLRKLTFEQLFTSS
jgi:hypothetical protein